VNKIAVKKKIKKTKEQKSLKETVKYYNFLENNHCYFSLKKFLNQKNVSEVQNFAKMLNATK